MPCGDFSYMLRRTRTEIRELFSRDLIHGKTDETALLQIQDLLSAESVRKKRKELKDLYAFLIWNMAPENGEDAWKHAGVQKELNGKALDAATIDALSRVDQHLKSLPTAWDRKRSKWTYVCLIRDMEMFRSDSTRLRKFSTSKAPAMSAIGDENSTGGQNSGIPAATDDQGCDEKELTVSPVNTSSSTRARAASSKSVRLRPSVDGIYLAAARNELAISSLEQRLISSEARLKAYEGELASLRSIIDHLMQRSTMERVDSAAEARAYGRGGSPQSSAPPPNDGKFVFFDAI